MFKNLLQFWKGKDFLSQVLEEFKDMLDDAQVMFDAVCKDLIYNEKKPGLREKLYNIDKTINNMQKDIRKRIIEHLSLQPTVDVSTCLLLMSVVKDAERVGDYAKNFFQINKLLKKPLDTQKYKELFNNIEEEIDELFVQTKEAFIHSDETKATKTWQHQLHIKNKCDEIIKTLAKSDLNANEAICFALISRYFRRIASHLTNIATSVIVPLSDLDYFDERRKEEDDI